MVGIPTFVNRSFRLQLREQNHVADAFLAEEHHAQAVNADADAARRGHAVLERDQPNQDILHSFPASDKLYFQ
jgi:hypothetical protein